MSSRIFYEKNDGYASHIFIKVCFKAYSKAGAYSNKYSIPAKSESGKKIWEHGIFLPEVASRCRLSGNHTCLFGAQNNILSV